MTARTTTRRAIALSGAVVLAFGLTACGSDDNKDDNNNNASGDCAAYSSYGDLKGKTITLYTGIVTPEDKPQIDSYTPF